MKKFCVTILLVFLYIFSGETNAFAELTPYVKSLIKRAEQGEIKAQFLLGLGHELGKEGLPKDYQKAKYWYKLAANQGSDEAQHSLGAMYEEGIGVRQDYQKAKNWYEKSAHQGNSTAQTKLGFLYALGQGTRQDYHKAKFWFEKAANQGDAHAQNMLGHLYGHGLGVRQSLSEAKEWYGKACDNGNQKGCDAYARLNRDH